MSDSVTTDERPTATPRRRGRRRWIVIGATLLAILGGCVWFLYAAHGYRREQRAVRDFRELFGEGVVYVEDSALDQEGSGPPPDASAVVALMWSGADWLRAPFEAVGHPVLLRVKSVTIYDSDVDDDIIEPLSRFASMEQLTVAGDSAITRDGFRRLRKAAPNAVVWIEHDDERFAGRDALGGGDVDETLADGERSEEDDGADLIGEP